MTFEVRVKKMHLLKATCDFYLFVTLMQCRIEILCSYLFVVVLFKVGVCLFQWGKMFVNE